jgi:Tfp pilus assembly protein PilW
MQNSTPSARRQLGFSLLELMVATGIFLVITGALLSLFSAHQPVYNRQQNLAEVNIALRNSVAQMQLDVSNAGANYYTGINIPNYPVGVVINNNVVASGGDCRSSGNYSTNCFDSFTVVKADASTPPVAPSTTAGCVTTSTSSDIYLGPSGSATGYATAALATAAAANYKSGDQLLLVKGDGSQYTTIKLTANAATGTGATAPNTNLFVKLAAASHSTTSTTTAGLNTSSNDTYGMTTHSNSMLGEQYCSTDFLLRLTPIQYAVDLTDPTNPVLTRTIGGVTQTLAQRTLATQIIGFKVGASLFNNTTDTDTTTYSFDASSYNNGTSVPYNYTLIRSVMVSLIGRTKTDPSVKFNNSFDSGQYEIQGVSMIVNPRNMSMTD